VPVLYADKVVVKLSPRARPRIQIARTVMREDTSTGCRNCLYLGGRAMAKK